MAEDKYSDEFKLTELMGRDYVDSNTQDEEDIGRLINIQYILGRMHALDFFLSPEQEKRLLKVYKSALDSRYPR